METREHQVGAVAVVEPQGALVDDAGETLRARLRDWNRRRLGRVVLDATGVPFIDSKGLEALTDVGEEMIDAGRTLKVCGANETVREVFDLVGMGPLIEQYENVNDAVRSFL